MTKVIFTQDFDYRPSREWRVIIAYKASATPYTVTKECAEAAIKAGCAKEVPKTRPKDKDAQRLLKA